MADEAVTNAELLALLEACETPDSERRLCLYGWAHAGEPRRLRVGQLEDIRQEVLKLLNERVLLPRIVRELLVVRKVPCRATGIHVLGCCEYHAHRVPDCCSSTCWCSEDASKQEPHA
jgi:hypothetical protein